MHAKQAEEYFIGKNILDTQVLKKGIAILSEEIKPMQEGHQASAAYRKKLAINLFYKV